MIYSKRKKEIEEKYKEYIKTFNLEEFRKKLFKDPRYKWKLCFNDFPYDTPEYINQYILWFDTREVNKTLAEKIIKNIFPDNVVWFMDNNFSEEQLFHVHIFNNKLDI